MRWHARRVGTLERADDASLRFTYEPAWLSSADSFAICAALPLAEGAHGPRETRAFFANLLPDGALREELARRHGVSVDNDFALLANTGHECAGALTIGPRTPGRASYRTLSLDELEALATRDAGVSDIIQELAGEVRLSLAGAQSKLPVLITAAGEIALPLGDTASTHILKFESIRFKHLPANEVWMHGLANAVGIDTAEIELKRFGASVASLSQRYDRTRDEAGYVQRLHQQDFCQALARLPTERYEAEGGPAVAECVRLVEHTSSDPLSDLDALLTRILFNCAAGNADAHGKNFALLHTPSSGWRLAPAYDLVCTKAFTGISEALAMRIGQHAQLDKIHHADICALARDFGMGARLVTSRAVDLCDAVLDALPTTTTQFQHRFGDSPAIERCMPTVRKQASGLRRRLASSLT